MKYKYLFGPVPSRRLGMSLGIDPVPLKVCSLDCVYCEVGKTTRLTCEREEFFPLHEIEKELLSYFKENPDPDYITFSGSGEPTLYTRIGEVIGIIRKIRPRIPIAVLTNGTLFNRKEVRDALKGADVVLPSLDAASQEIFEKINRPAVGLSIEGYIQGLTDFRENYRGKIWLEVFILPGYNDDEKELLGIKEAVERIRPDEVQLNSLDRPGTLSDLQKASMGELKRIIALWGLDNVRIIGRTQKRKNIRSYREDIESTIISTVERRPCTVSDLSKILGLHINELNKYLDVLEGEGRIESVREKRGVFYRLM